MAEDADPAQPRSMSSMAGLIDTRVNPTEVNRLPTSRPIEWFERNLIGIVPLHYAGALRRVYPGFVQLAAVMSMNLDRHVKGPSANHLLPSISRCRAASRLNEVNADAVCSRLKLAKATVAPPIRFSLADNAK
jgi:polyhydroxyalkanoate depolymerase